MDKQKHSPPPKLLPQSACFSSINPYRSADGKRLQWGQMGLKPKNKGSNPTYLFGGLQEFRSSRTFGSFKQDQNILPMFWCSNDVLAMFRCWLSEQHVNLQTNGLDVSFPCLFIKISCLTNVWLANSNSAEMQHLLQHRYIPLVWTELMRSRQTDLVFSSPKDQHFIRSWPLLGWDNF